MGYRVVSYKAFQDNFIHFLIDKSYGHHVVIDPGDYSVVVDFLKDYGGEIRYILQTHSHRDHVGGVKPILQDNSSCKLICYADLAGVREKDLLLNEDGMELKIRLLRSLGHIQDHVSFYVESLESLFSGDALFSFGCGRIFDGSYGQFVETMELFYSLPDSTKIYFAHEYTLNNLDFVINKIDSSKELLDLREDVSRRLARGETSCPSLLGVEKMWNPFLAFLNGEYASRLGLEIRDREGLFKYFRDLKDDY